MLTYSFTNIGSDSLYIHLYKCIKSDIIHGAIAPGTKLPSKRAFAKNLGISVITIENSYAQLIAEGYIYSIPKKGYFAADIRNQANQKEKPSLAESIPSSSECHTYAADFVSNQASKEQFPFSIWAKLVRELLSNHQTELLTNPPSGGSLFLRESIAKHLKDFRNMQVEPAQIVIGAGTEYLYGLLIQLLGREKCYGVEDPGYRKIAQVYKSNQVDYRYVSMEQDGIRMEDLDHQRVEVIHLSPSHHFPTGKVTPISKRYELLGWAAKDKNRYIIEDDYDSEFRLAGQPIPPLYSMDALEKVIYMNTFTKTLASTIRISYMILPKHLVSRFYETLSFYSCTVPNLEQYTLARFIFEGYFEKHMNRMRTYYHKKRDYLLEELQKSGLAKYASISEEDAGLHFLLHLEIPCSDEDFKLRMERRGIRICALSEYYAAPTHRPEHIFVINYSSLDESQIKDAILQLTLEIKKISSP